MESGHRVLVTGALGAVGRYAVWAAKAVGATVVAAVRSSSFADARTLGADEVVAIYSGDPFDRIVDTIGGAAVNPLCRAIAANGIIRTVATDPIPQDGVPVEMPFYMLHADAAMLARVVRAAAAEEVSPPIASFLPLVKAADAQRLVDSGKAVGKIILIP